MVEQLYRGRALNVQIIASPALIGGGIQVDGSLGSTYKQPVVLSWRSVGAGLLAGCIAFLVAYFINPVHLGVLGAVLLVLSALIGFFAATTLGQKFSRQDSDQRTAVMVFAFVFFVSIYAPISAIWANSPFYSWTNTLKGIPKSDLLSSAVAAALEKTAVSTYLGMLVLLGLAHVLPRWAEKKKQPSKHNQTDPAPR